MLINLKREPYMFCICCRNAIKKSQLLVKTYGRTEVILCRRCARQVVQDIQEKFKEDTKCSSR